MLTRRRAGGPSRSTPLPIPPARLHAVSASELKNLGGVATRAEGPRPGRSCPGGGGPGGRGSRPTRRRAAGASPPLRCDGDHDHARGRRASPVPADDRSRAHVEPVHTRTHPKNCKRIGPLRWNPCLQNRAAFTPSAGGPPVAAQRERPYVAFFTPHEEVTCNTDRHGEEGARRRGYLVHTGKRTVSAGYPARFCS